MWRELEESAIKIGLKLDEYWNLTPAQFTKYMKVYNDKQKEELEKTDVMNYLLGKYIAYAFNDIKHYPKDPFLADKKPRPSAKMSDEEMERIAKYNVLKLGGRCNEK